MAVAAAACGGGTAGDGGTTAASQAPPAAAATATPPGDRKHLLERVDDAAVVQLYADGFEKLPLQQKVLVWHLYQAALAVKG